MTACIPLDYILPELALLEADIAKRLNPIDSSSATHFQRLLGLPATMVPKNPPPDERVVYLALKHVFKGANAEVQMSKAINKLIKQHQKQEDVADLFQQHDFDVICNVARTLLADDIFASTIKAKARFPELFNLSPTQSAERAASENEAAKNEANAIEDAALGRWKTTQVADRENAPGMAGR